MNDEQIRQTNLENLLNLIHTEGLEKAKAEGEQIVQTAKAQAERMVEEAQRLAKTAHDEAIYKIEKAEAAQLERLQMAQRDLLLGLEEQLTLQFQNFVAQAVPEALTPAVLEKFLLALAPGFAGKSLEITLSPEDQKALEKALLGGLAQKLGVDLKTQGSQKVKAGMWIVESGAHAFLDFSSSALAERLSRYLSPRLKELWTQARGKERR